ncbi:hypothetical protein QE375_002902 [Microbacterium foliorum]|uniref:Uncharacterized protein n=1 Tax=Microbacterium foliorum TaxID=104336 RepID=A0ABU1HUM3_9MICO|nr:hypothetical protein [Microbacterium foliorum]MDR6143348.1 hypothetical protein [Microbacterium foliorum]
MPYLFPDNSVIVCFAHAEELDVLEQYLRGNGRVVEAVSREISDSTGHVPALRGLDQQAWFGEPIPIVGAANTRVVEGIRVAVFGGGKAKPREHLGESQTLHLLKTDAHYQDSIWLTEDREAFRFAQRQHITTRDTFGILCDMVGYLDLSIERAFEIAQHILDVGEPMLRPPDSPRDFLV